MFEVTNVVFVLWMLSWAMFEVTSVVFVTGMVSPVIKDRLCDDCLC